MRGSASPWLHRFVTFFLSQFHDQRDLCLFIGEQSLVFEDAGLLHCCCTFDFIFFISISSANITLKLSQDWLYIATCMSAYIMGPCYVVLMFSPTNVSCCLLALLLTILQSVSCSFSELTNVGSLLSFFSDGS